MTPQAYIKKCLELSERAALSDHEMRDCITALPKVCEALKLAMEEFERITMLVAEMKETKPTESVLVAEACQGIANSAVHMINKIFDEADGG